jgi:hypothetical protein
VCAIRDSISEMYFCTRSDRTDGETCSLFVSSTMTSNDPLVANLTISIAYPSNFDLDLILSGAIRKLFWARSRRLEMVNV